MPPKNESLSLPVPSRPRRTQAARTAETRGAVIEAVVACIAELGFAGTTAVEIARRAGVTWGAVQHHFGGKDGILVAVLEDSFTRFAARLEGLPSSDASAEARVAAFVDRAWEHFRSPHFRSTFEILLNYLGRNGPADHESWQNRMFEAWDGVWTEVFFDSPLDRARRAELEHYTVSVLSGLAATLMMGGPGAELPPRELEILKRTLVEELGIE